MKCSTSWSLVIATYNRASILETCIALAIDQDCPPKEIIVVDASQEWLRSRDIISAMAKMASINCVYLQADEKSLTIQRNQGIAAASSDVIFLIDDDSLMHPSCASEIISIYDADTEGVLAGVQASLTSDIPHKATITDSRKDSGKTDLSSGSKIWSFVKQWIWREIFLMNSSKLFICYDGTFYRRKLPKNLSTLEISSTDLFHGCRMTYRRASVKKELFDPTLLSYCPMEDLDASYRVSRHGMLVTAEKAKLHHFESGAGRVKRRQAAMLTVLNQAFLIRKHSADVQLRQIEFDRLLIRRIFSEFFKDLLSRRWNLPQLRGLLAARRYLTPIFTMPEKELVHFYRNLQTKILSIE